MGFNMKAKGEQIKEKMIENILFALSLSAIIFLTGIILTLFKEALPAFREIGLAKILFSKDFVNIILPKYFATA